MDLKIDVEEERREQNVVDRQLYSRTSFLLRCALLEQMRLLIINLIFRGPMTYIKRQGISDHNVERLRFCLSNYLEDKQYV